MSSSARKLADLPLLVFTASRTDYGIMVRSGTVSASLEAVVDNIARQCAPCLMDGFNGCVGVGAWGRWWLAFRVFDVGIYLGRPHTMGLVAILVPQQSLRSWTIGQALAALTPPVPGCTTYPLADLDLADSVEPSIPQFQGIRDWENDGCPMKSSSILTFCDPPERAPAITMPTDRRCPRRWPMVLCLAVAAGAGTWYGIPLLSQGRSKPPVQVPSGVGDKDKIQNVLRKLLDLNHPLLQPSVPPKVLRVKVCAIGAEATRRMSQLEGSIDRLEKVPAEGQSNARHLQGVIKAELEFWQSGFSTGSPFEAHGPEPSGPEVSDNIHTLDLYLKARELMETMVRRDSGSSDFRDMLVQLRSLLASVGRSKSH